MPHKRVRIQEKDFDAIAAIINHQSNTGIDKEQDKDGMLSFANTVACRNIAEHLAEYFNDNISDEVFNYNVFVVESLKEQEHEKSICR